VIVLLAVRIAYTNRRCGETFLKDRTSSGLRVLFARERDCSGCRTQRIIAGKTGPCQRTFTMFTANRPNERIHDRRPYSLDGRPADWMNFGERDACDSIAS